MLGRGDRELRERDVSDPARPRKVPFFVHLLNLAALAVLGLILLLSIVVQIYQLVILVPIVVLVVLYWRSRSIPTAAAYYLVLSLTLGLWILICENIIGIDNLLGTHITSKLDLGAKLTVYASDHLATASKARLRQTCCKDPMSYHLRPGSLHKETYDCDTCNEPYSVVVDETGYLNPHRGLYHSSSAIDLFLVGDSLMQGIGMPSVLDLVRHRIPLNMWNLSLSGYGPREKINATLTYALPKNPKWLIIDFYSANDPMDALEDAVCESFKDFRCKFSKAEVRRRFLEHPLYGPLLVEPDYAFASFESYAENYLTVAVNRYFINAAKGAIKKLADGTPSTPARTSDDGRQLAANDVAHPAEANVAIRPGHLLAWAKAGMSLTHKSYQGLVAKLRDSKANPAVILLYTPSAYEVYCDILLDRNPDYDEVAAFQVEAQRSFAAKNGWIFLDLTKPLREKTAGGKTWIYGRYDRAHWSRAGTAIVADVLTEELSRLVGQ